MSAQSKHHTLSGTDCRSLPQVKLWGDSFLFEHHKYTLLSYGVGDTLVKFLSEVYRSLKQLSPSVGVL